MNILNIENKNVYFYLALEEYLIRNTEEEYFFLWSSSNSVVCGKHQNIYEEINLQYVIDNKIELARRLSGGGTVYHDNGNLNFTFILNKEFGKQIDFKKHTEPIFKYLKSLKIDVSYSERNDLFIDGMKISGNAEHVYKNRVLHHGTLLFNTDLHKLNKSITSKGDYDSKSVKSVRKDVININKYINGTDFNTFKYGLLEFVKNFYPHNNSVAVNDEINNEVNLLVKNKYETNEWIYNYSPKFIYKGTIKSKNIVFEFRIEKGVIVESNFSNNKIYNHMFEGKSYNLGSLMEIIKTNKLDEKFQIEQNKLVYCFFE